ncbi:MAG: tRNA (adenosine(37)-N6)-threonylcarbamoyltransferase complex dimerization subunit type 1 TsaB [Novosphingobium sp.]
MRTLVIDSATEACSVALLDGDGLIAGDFRMLGRGHAEQLVPMLAALPERGRAGRIAVDVGPGSFTGIRVGLAAAKALAFAWGADLVGYGALDLVSAMARAEAGAAPLDIAMTGGHGQWFVQAFAADGGATAPVEPLSPEQAAARSTAPVVAGSRADELAALRGSGRALPLWPDARRFALLGSAALTADPHPAYGRAPDARLPAAVGPG